MTKPTLAVLYGQPDRLSTSYQTRQLSRALEAWVNPLPLTVKSGADGKWGRALNRLSSNYLRPLVSQPDADYVLYGNDGLANLNHWRAKKLLYWYDAPRDWSKEPPRRWQLAHWLRYRNLLAADHIFAVSRAQVEVAARVRGGREDCISYLPVGVDCRIFDPATADAGRARQKFKLPATTIIGYLGYLGIWDGRFAGEPIVEIAPELLKQHDAHFLIVGFGPALEVFKGRVEQAGLSSHFTFTGFVPDELLADCLAAMDICIDTLEEGFHSEARSETKLKQYMAMGRACVATAIGENCVDLNDGECGVLVEPESAALLRGVASLCGQPELRARLGRAARRRAVEVYDWTVLAARMAASLGLAGSAS
jgi:glycosyltransferase involved in cell wall biosynthesis